MMTLMGFGNTLVDVSGFTLLQRSVPDDKLARVFGVYETLLLLSVASVRAGGYFGEIALLSDVPRQASALVRSDCDLVALEGEDFIAAVTGHARSKDAANTVIQAYGAGLPLGGLR